MPMLRRRRFLPDVDGLEQRLCMDAASDAAAAAAAAMPPMPPAPPIVPPATMPYADGTYPPVAPVVPAPPIIINPNPPVATTPAGPGLPYQQTVIVPIFGGGLNSVPAGYQVTGVTLQVNGGAPVQAMMAMPINPTALGMPVLLIMPTIPVTNVANGVPYAITYNTTEDPRPEGPPPPDVSGVFMQAANVNLMTNTAYSNPDGDGPDPGGWFIPAPNPNPPVVPANPIPTPTTTPGQNSTIDGLPLFFPGPSSFIPGAKS